MKRALLVLLLTCLISNVVTATDYFNPLSNYGQKFSRSARNRMALCNDESVKQANRMMYGYEDTLREHEQWEREQRKRLERDIKQMQEIERLRAARLANEQAELSLRLQRQRLGAEQRVRNYGSNIDVSTIRSLTNLELNNIAGRCGVANSMFSGTLYNGNANLFITSITVEITYGANVTRRYKFPIPYNIVPYSISPLTGKILDGDGQMKSWTIVGAEGCELSKRTDPSIRKLTDAELESITGRGSVANSAFSGTIYNGNANISITTLTLEISYNSGITRRYKVLVPSEIVPYSAYTLYEEILGEGSQMQSWAIIEAEGKNIY